MRQEKETMLQQIRYRNEQLSKLKRELTDAEISKERVTIKLQQENTRLRESHMNLEQLK